MSHDDDTLPAPVARKVSRYRKVRDITADELLAVLTHEPQHQISLFIRLGGDPHDHDYARLSFLTRQLRERGIPVASSRLRGLWLERGELA